MTRAFWRFVACTSSSSIGRLSTSFSTSTCIETQWLKLLSGIILGSEPSRSTWPTHSSSRWGTPSLSVSMTCECVYNIITLHMSSAMSTQNLTVSWRNVAIRLVQVAPDGVHEVSWRHVRNRLFNQRHFDPFQTFTQRITYTYNM
jgi:hypothetical protein